MTALPLNTVNPFVPSAPFLYPLKTSESQTVFWCFQGVGKGCIGNKWVNKAPRKIPKFLLNCGTVSAEFQASLGESRKRQNAFPQNLPLREKCSNTEFFLLPIFLHSDWIRRDTEYGPEKTPYLDTFYAVFTAGNRLKLRYFMHQKPFEFYLSLGWMKLNSPYYWLPILQKTVLHWLYWMTFPSAQTPYDRFMYVPHILCVLLTNYWLILFPFFI